MRFFRRKRDPKPVRLVVGLGNPGPQYEGTRHNVGFRVVEELARRHGIKVRQRICRARVGAGQISDVGIALAKPQTFMNRSGDAVSPLARRYGLAPSQILVIYDDLDLPLGRLRVRQDGSAGGHNGIKSLIERLGTRDFPRVRVGIGRPAGSDDAIDHVLSEFTTAEEPIVARLIEQAADAAECWLAEDVEAAMNRFNVRGEGSESAPSA